MSLFHTSTSPRALTGRFRGCHVEKHRVKGRGKKEGNGGNVWVGWRITPLPLYHSYSKYHPPVLCLDFAVLKCMHDVDAFSCRPPRWNFLYLQADVTYLNTIISNTVSQKSPRTTRCRENMFWSWWSVVRSTFCALLIFFFFFLSVSHSGAKWPGGTK